MSFASTHGRGYSDIDDGIVNDPSRAALKDHKEFVEIERPKFSHELGFSNLVTGSLLKL